MKRFMQGFISALLIMIAGVALAAASNRFTYNPTLSGGQHLALAVSYTVKAQQEIARAKSIADSVTAGGVTPANIEQSAEFAGAVGQGAGFYSAIVTLNTDLTAVPSSLLGNLDQGN